MRCIKLRAAWKWLILETVVRVVVGRSIDIARKSDFVILDVALVPRWPTMVIAMLEVEVSGRVSPRHVHARRVRLLLVAADVEELARIDVLGELRAIQHELALVGVGHALDASVLPAPTLGDLHRGLLEYRPHIVHFSGHCGVDGIWLRDDERGNGAGVVVSPSVLTGLLAPSAPEAPGHGHLLLAVFSACDSAALAQAVADQLGCAVGFSAPVEDRSARGFAVAFYRALAAGESLEQAFEQARTMVAALDPAHAEHARLFRGDGFDPGVFTLFGGSELESGPEGRSDHEVDRRPARERALRRIGRLRGQDVRLDPVCQALDQGELIVVAGSGIRVAAGLPSWPELARGVFETCASTSGESLDEISALLVEGRLLDALSELCRVMGQVPFGHAVERLLDDTGYEVPAVAHAIAGLAPRLRAVLTTNLDRVVDRALAGQWPIMSRVTGDLAQREHIVIKLHGTLEQRDTWVLTGDHYRLARHRDATATRLPVALFASRVLLFVGYGLNDPDFLRLLESFPAMDDGQPPRHHALVCDDMGSRARRRRVQRCGIQLVDHANRDGQHQELAKLLRSIAAP